jgi:hypothetical protein
LGNHDRTRLGLGASAAGLGAGSEAGPFGDLAVDGASLHVANAHFPVGAFVAIVCGGNDNIVVARLDAFTAGLGAGSPGVPGVFAVDGARVGVAVLRGHLCAACNAACFGGSDS